MPESYRCECKNDTWEIFGHMIKCAHCGREYELEEVSEGLEQDNYYLPFPKDFNKNRSKMNQ